MKETLGRPEKSEVHESLSGEEGKIGYIDFGEWVHQSYCGGCAWGFLVLEDAIQKCRT